MSPERRQRLLAIQQRESSGGRVPVGSRTPTGGSGSRDRRALSMGSPSKLAASMPAAAQPPAPSSAPRAGGLGGLGRVSEDKQLAAPDPSPPSPDRTSQPAPRPAAHHPIRPSQRAVEGLTTSASGLSPARNTALVRDPWHGSPISPLTGKYIGVAPASKSRSAAPAMRESYIDEDDEHPERMPTLTHHRPGEAFSFARAEGPSAEEIQAAQRAAEAERARAYREELKFQMLLKAERDAAERDTISSRTSAEQAHLDALAAEDERRKAVLAAQREDARRRSAAVRAQLEEQRQFDHEWKAQEFRAVEASIASTRDALAAEKAARVARTRALQEAQRQQLDEVRAQREATRVHDEQMEREMYENTLRVEREREAARQAFFAKQHKRYEDNVRATKQIWEENQQRSDDLDGRIQRQWREQEKKRDADEANRRALVHQRNMEQQAYLKAQMDAKAAREAEEAAREAAFAAEQKAAVAAEAERQRQEALARKAKMREQYDQLTKQVTASSPFF